MQIGGAGGGRLSGADAAVSRPGAEPIAVSHRGDVTRVEHPGVDDADCDHPRDGARCHGHGQSDLLGLVYRSDIGDCDRLRGAADRGLGAEHVRGLGPDHGAIRWNPTTQG